MRLADNPALRLKLEGWRSRLVLLLLLTWFAGLGLRAGWLQMVDNVQLRKRGEQYFVRELVLPANRGMVTDRNGEPLAISIPAESIWASTEVVDLTPEQRRALAGILKMDPADLARRLDETSSPFVSLKRQIPTEVAQRVMDLKIPGLLQRREYRRYYPAGQEMAHVVGFTGAEDKGQAGIEMTANGTLQGRDGVKKVIKDRNGRVVEESEGIRLPVQGRDVTLSIDSHIQHLAYRELKNAVAAHGAKAGAIVVLDARSGEVLGLANLPDYNPNSREGLSGPPLRNRSVTDTFEPGSTLKPFTIAAGLETGQYRPDTMIQTAPGTLAVGPNTIHDAHRHGALTVAEVIQKSSNVGAAKIALSLKPEVLWTTLSQVGFGALPQSGMLGEVQGNLRPFKTWKPIEQATMSYGHGISVSLVQLARAYTVFANGGMLLPLAVEKRDATPVGHRVLSESTAQAVSAMLETVVLPGGTAPRAQVPGYRVAGKTGTAHKQQGASYASDRYVSSFIGYAPASNPRLIVAVMIDEPTGGEYYGGTVAAPAFANVMGGGLRQLGVPQDGPVVPPPAIDGLPLLKEDT